MTKTACTALILLTSSILAPAQFRWGAAKTVQLSISRPPDVGLTVKRIAFGQPSGECSSELVDRMIMPDFQSNDIQVIERQHLDQILAEHSFNQSIYADAASAAKLGKILGPSALILLSVYSCRPEQNSLYQDTQDISGAFHRIYISRTRFTLEGSLRIVDLTSGQVLGSHNFQDKPERQNTAENGQPEFPPADELKDKAMEDIKWQVHEKFFPSVQTKDLVFYDDKDCGLKDAYGVWHRGDAETALKLIQAGIDQCSSERKKDKALARAFYDAGLGYCLQRDYAKAKPLFVRAMQTKGAEAVSETAADCDHAESGAAQVKSYLDRFARIPAPTPIEAARAPALPEKTEVQQPSVANKQPADAAAAPKPSVEERLKKLDVLLKKGLINQKEYDKKRAEILKDI
jgi:hypothetical protein